MAERPEGLQAWFSERLPKDWFIAAPEVTVDREEILVIGSLADVETSADATDADKEMAREARIARFREETRAQRMRIADEAEHRFRRHVSWGAGCGDVRYLFTTIGVPVMTRLRQPERMVLDTLVDAGIARSRSEALAWCVHLVGEHQEEWIRSLREALSAIEKLRAQGPSPVAMAEGSEPAPRPPFFLRRERPGPGPRRGNHERTVY